MPPSTAQNIKPPILILDGGLGTTLQSLPKPPVLNRYLWSSTPLLLEPFALADVHGKFIAAGADIIETATYQLSFPGVTFMDYRDDVEVVTYKRAKEVMRSAVTLARHAADGNRDGKPLEVNSRTKAVALSLGPYGATMSPSTEYSAAYDSRHNTVANLKAWHAERIKAFAENEECWRDVDYVAFETFGRCDEIKAVRQVMTELFASGVEKKRWWISCVFPGSAADAFLPSDDTLDDAVEAMLEVVVQHDGSELEKPWGIGINCTKVLKLRTLIEGYESAVKTVLAVGEAWPALLLYPDGTKAGEYYDTKLQEWVMGGDGGAEDGVKQWHEDLRDIVEETRNRAPWKAVVVGGCCRTGPKEIENLRRRFH